MCHGGDKPDWDQHLLCGHANRQSTCPAATHLQRTQRQVGDHFLVGKLITVSGLNHACMPSKDNMRHANHRWHPGGVLLTLAYAQVHMQACTPSLLPAEGPDTPPGPDLQTPCLEQLHVCRAAEADTTCLTCKLDTCHHVQNICRWGLVLHSNVFIYSCNWS